MHFDNDRNKVMPHVLSIERPLRLASSVLISKQARTIWRARCFFSCKHIRIPDNHKDSIVPYVTWRFISKLWHNCIASLSLFDHDFYTDARWETRVILCLVKAWQPSWARASRWWSLSLTSVASFHWRTTIDDGLMLLRHVGMCTMHLTVVMMQNVTFFIASCWLITRRSMQQGSVSWRARRWVLNKHCRSKSISEKSV